MPLFLPTYCYYLTNNPPPAKIVPECIVKRDITVLQSLLRSAAICIWEPANELIFSSGLSFLAEIRGGGGGDQWGDGKPNRVLRFIVD